jgi:hypothetical protein
MRRAFSGARHQIIRLAVCHLGSALMVARGWAGPAGFGAARSWGSSSAGFTGLRRLPLLYGEKPVNQEPFLQLDRIIHGGRLGSCRSRPPHRSSRSPRYGIR